MSYLSSSTYRTMFIKNRNLFLSILSAILLSIPWLVPATSWLLFFAFVPLLLVEDDLAKNNVRWGIRYYGLTFVLWNILTTWWIYNATLIGAVGAFVGNAAQMCLVFAIFRWVKRGAGDRIGYATLLIAWLAWEWFYFDAEITWTWLTLGNGFAKDFALIQWYEFTGTLGGSLWVWIANLYIFFIMRRKLSGTPFRHQRPALVGCLLWILVPASASLIRYYTYQEKENPANVLLLQPNIDPYTEKFGKISYREQANILMNLAAQGVDASTDYIVGPETAIPGRHLEEDLGSHPDIVLLKSVISKYPKVNFITGIESQRYYYGGENASLTARPISGTQDSYDVYNTAIQVNNSNHSDSSLQIYHKSKLVVGVEMLPYYDKLKFIHSLSIDLGGSSGTYGTQTTRTVFTSADQRFRLGVAICYESVYGQYFSGYVRNGANLMAVITNDGWWGNTSGYHQHLSYASLRAIETRRSIMRSGNTGISAFVNQRGQIVEQTPWWVRTTLKGSVNANDKLTFYTLHGDVIGRLAGFLFILCLLYGVKQRIMK